MLGKKVSSDNNKINIFIYRRRNPFLDNQIDTKNPINPSAIFMRKLAEVKNLRQCKNKRHVQILSELQYNFCFRMTFVKSGGTI
jgi:hypothetical protein